MRLRRHNTLFPGDILLFKPRGKKQEDLSDKFISWGQQFFKKVPSKVNYVHVAMVDWNEEYILESVWPKTRVTNLAVKRSTSTDKIEVWRIKHLTKEQCTKMLDYGHSHLGLWYDLPLLLTGCLSLKHTEICSVFVSQMCHAAGLDIPYGSTGKKLVIPDDYVDCNTMLERVM